MKKSLVLALIAVLVLSFASMASAAFTDTPNWAKGQIDKLAELKIVDSSTTTFNSTANVTREQFAKMIVLAKGLSLENPATATFKDVATTSWAFPYVEAAAKAKLIEGYNGKFDPTAKITREQVAKIIVLAAGKTADATKAINFDDKASISDWAKGYVAVAADLKLMQGSNNKFDPKGNTTRAQAAVLTFNEMKYEGKVADVVVKAPGTVDDFNFTAGDGNTGNSIVIDGKSYNLTSDAMVIANGQKVGLKAILKNKTVQFERTSTNDSANIYKITLGSDYVIKKGSLKETGEDNTNKYLIIGTDKVYYDKDKTLLVQALDSSDNISSNASLTVNGSFMVFVDSKNLAYYAFDTSAKAAKGTIQAIGKDDKGDYVTIGDKKYYAKKNSAGDPSGDQVTVKINGSLTHGAPAVDYVWADLKAKYVAEITTNSDGYITDISANESLPAYKVANKVLYVAENSVYRMYLKLVGVNDDGVVSGVAYVKSSTTVSSVPSDNAAVALGATATESKDLTITIDGVSANFQDIAKNSYLEVTTNTDSPSKITKIAAVSPAKGYVVGIVDSFTKVADSTDDDYNKVTRVKISGKDYVFDGKSTRNDSSGKGYLVNSNFLIQNGDVVAAVLNAAGEIVGIDYVYDIDATKTVDSATVVAVAGDASKMTALATTNVTPSTIYVPDNTIEVRYWDSSAWKYAWLTQVKYQAQDDSDKNVYTKLVANSTGAKLTLGDLKVGDIISAGVIASDLISDVAVNTFTANVGPAAQGADVHLDTASDLSAANQSARWTTSFNAPTVPYTSNYVKVIIKK